ncbi:transporter substrate-binding domain-containing protein [Tessaracoccus sp. ZS01]|uniref:transporter substrate-binding domain-containing protein n=1 Tax=Tessaracoccus sp. ZS01 TaxID=1906324 RepID=UPI0009F9D27E|nr:transporter substrate-binding domain-containing protein [Tessaracoccus sp. ZS01]MCG6566716.1 ABC transporter substrate-binding protein [Tessaracoccus sp. ZS01]
MMALLRLLTLVTALLLLAGCSEPEYPRDPEDTLLRAMDGGLTVGVSAHPPHIDISDEGEVTGPEAEILTGYAESIGAEIEWVEGAESELMEKIKLGELDVVAGGLTAKSPWTTHAAMTRPYGKAAGPDGKEQKLVFATRLGENALLSSLERHLIEEGLKP